MQPLPPNPLEGPSYYDPTTGQWQPLPQGAGGAYYNPLMAGGQNPYAMQAGALYGEEAAAGQRLSAQNILSQIRSRDASAAASFQSAQQAMRAAGLQADELKERIRQFDITTAEGKRQFDLDFGLDREKFELQRQQLQLQGAEAIINAPRGPADFFAYASRLPSVAQAGGSALGNIFGQALQNISGESLASLQQGDVLSNSQLATDLVRASQGGAVSDATSTFLRRSLGVNVPGATQVAQQQAQQAAQTAAAPPAPGAAPAAGQPTYEQWLAQSGYDIPMGDVAYARSSDPTWDALANQPGLSSGDIAKYQSYRPGVPSRSYMPWELQQQYHDALYPGFAAAESQAVRAQIDANAGGTTGYKGGGVNWNYQAAPSTTPVLGAGQYTPGTSPPWAPPLMGAGAASQNPLYAALLQGGPSFMQRLGALGSQIPRGYGTSIQEWNRFEPTAQAMYTGLLSEAGLQTPEDFLAGVVKAAPNFAPSRMTRMR